MLYKAGTAVVVKMRWLFMLAKTVVSVKLDSYSYEVEKQLLMWILNSQAYEVKQLHK
jgi:hypothetical protein